MSVTVIVGCQWGDEGKGKIVDVLSGSMDLVARYQGGPNAGHTVVIGADKFVLHTIPSGILHPACQCLIGNGVVVDVGSMMKEIDGLHARGINTAGRLFASEQAHLILPQHGLLDVARERSRAEMKIGTTGRGIGTAYADKTRRQGLRLCDYRHVDKFVANYRFLVDFYNRAFEEIYGMEQPNADTILDQLLGYRERVLSMLTDSVTMVNDALDQGKRVLAEGAQGILLDIDFGTYPYVTSSNPSPGGACTGLGISPLRVSRIIGIVKAYTTRVGEGPLPTELHGPEGEELRREGAEFGATTGRPRRCGWFDAVGVRRALQISRCTELVLTKLDVLDIYRELKVCVAYDTPAGRMEVLPFDLEYLKAARPIYESVPGWAKPTRGATRLDDLPGEAIAYVKRLEGLLGVPVRYVSTGPGREHTIRREDDGSCPC